MLNDLNFWLRDLIFPLVLVNFIALVFFVVINHLTLKRFLSRITFNFWIVLVLIFFASLLIRISLPILHHEMFIDEPWYMEAGKNMLFTGSQGHYPKSIGWPFLIFIVFLIFGVNNWTAIYASLFFGALSVFPVFLLSYALTDKKYLSLISASIFSLFPLHIFWSATAETNVASVFFTAMSMLFAFLYFREPSRGLFWLTMASFAFTAQIRPENYILPIVFLIWVFVIQKKKIFYGFKEILSDGLFSKTLHKYIGPLLFVLFLTAPNLIQVLHFNVSLNAYENVTEGAIIKPNWSFDNLIKNTLNLGPELFQTFDELIVIFMIIGFYYMLKNRRKYAVLLVSWFLVLWFTYFISFLDVLGGRSRVYLSFYPIFSILAAAGIWLAMDKARSLFRDAPPKAIPFLMMGMFFLLLFLNIGPYIPRASAEKVLETRIPEFMKRDIPYDCMIISGEDVIIKSTTDFNSIATEEFLNLRDKDKFFSEHKCVLFFEDMYCFYRKGFTKKLSECRELKNNYLTEEFLTYQNDNIKYTFYKLSNNK
ncbi:hypothetical protein A2227_08000 [Candidatus Falkowbacteria bacterium RIFOXYA2_FULL_47_19]|uniref:Uncharacterized protein n=1 Tax=Candidatus Falkowbacteria bacterium RIFOXYA2_FULL_47_19 TaxID=1797994 RepID=A0A1F5SFC2_9BACT|nr:MAG: hypothetical protein A2227_08000 [Candidatus Falkowbacteria bacterium RIFOXYA2_FULL_47_19]